MIYDYNIDIILELRHKNKLGIRYRNILELGHRNRLWLQYRNKLGLQHRNMLWLRQRNMLELRQRNLLGLQHRKTLGLRPGNLLRLRHGKILGLRGHLRVEGHLKLRLTSLQPATCWELSCKLNGDRNYNFSWISEVKLKLEILPPGY